MLRVLSKLFGGSRQASEPLAPPISSAPVEGGLYYLPNEDGIGYHVIKVLKVDAHGVHLRIYSNIFPDVPHQIDESVLYMAGMDRQEGERLGMGHMPLLMASFARWNARFFQQSNVHEHELEGYNYWAEAPGAGYFN